MAKNKGASSSSGNSNMKQNPSKEDKNTKEVFGQYTDRCRRLVAVNNHLHDIGAHIDLEIPTIVVVGNQSAGKSSLIEAMVGIPLPRSEGTCTRCPIECRLIETPGHRWSCTVTLRFEFDADGARMREVKEVEFGGTMLGIGEVEDRVRRAQIAVLNPGMSAQEVLNAENLGSITNELRFTSNVVCVKIQGDDVGHLSLIDLPGIISSVEDGGDKRDITLIQSLVRSYMSRPSTVIVETITCKDDIDNQSVHTFAREYDQDGERTIGVLTKPDTIEPGCHEAWLKILRGQSHRLKHGYFVVKNPSKAQLEMNIDFATAREQELDFFKATEPWSGREIPTDRVGVANLKRYLSELLSDTISKVLPGLCKKAKEKLAEVKTQLSEISQPVANPTFELISLIRKFAERIEKVLTAQSSMDFWHQQRDLLEVFRANIRMTAPVFELDKCSFGVSDDGITSACESITVFTLDDLKSLIRSCEGRNIPGLPPYQAVEHIVQQSREDWYSPAEQCVQKIGEILGKTLDEEIKVSFSRFSSLENRAKYVCENLLDDLVSECLEHCNKLFESEMNIVFSLNDHYLTRNKKTYYDACAKKLRGADGFEKRTVASGYDYEGNPTNAITAALSALAALGITGLDEKTLYERLIPISEENESAAQVMSMALAFWKVAFKRFIDAIALAIDKRLVMAVKDGLQQELLEKLQADIPETAALLMEEDRNVKQKRNDLLDQQNRLQKVVKELLNADTA